MDDDISPFIGQKRADILRGVKEFMDRGKQEGARGMICVMIAFGDAAESHLSFRSASGALCMSEVAEFGALALGELKAGDTLELVPERDNPYDAEAIAVKFHGTMLGYIPADSVGPLSTMFFYGHGAAFECRVLQVAPERSPWHQMTA